MLNREMVAEIVRETIEKGKTSRKEIKELAKRTAKEHYIKGYIEHIAFLEECINPHFKKAYEKMYTAYLEHLSKLLEVYFESYISMYLNCIKCEKHSDCIKKMTQAQKEL